MSFPMAHALVGCSIGGIGQRKKWNWKLPFLFFFLANAADLDFLPGILVGQPALFHRSVGHSLGAAFLAGFITALVIKLWKKHGFFRMFFLSTATYASHLFVDLLGSSPVMPLFWPLESAQLTERILAFETLPLNCNGFMDFACGLVSNAACIQRFWREIFFLVLTLFFFWGRSFLQRRLTVPKLSEGYVFAEGIKTLEST